MAKIEPRELEMEWEEVLDSSGYELEFTRLKADGTAGKPIVFQSQSTRWNGRVLPGRYRVRIRSRDLRGIGGDWLPAFEYWVRLPAPKPLQPSQGTRLASVETEADKVTFTWSPIEGAIGYFVEVFDSSGQRVKAEESESSSLTIKMKVAQDYSWQVTALMPEGKEHGQSPESRTGFTLAGGPTRAPDLTRPDTRFVQRLQWKPTPGAETYDVEVARKQETGWEVLERKSGWPNTNLDLNPRYPGGLYRLSVKANARLRPPSAAAEMEFPVYDGLRTTKAIREAKRREAIENAQNNYLLFIYQITMLQYLGVYQDLSGTKLRFNALSGTGRAGYAYFKPRSPWGLMGIADMAGLVVNGHNYTFAGAELQALWRTYINGVYQVRAHAGGVYKQTPQIKGVRADDVAVENIATVGPVAGVQLWIPAGRRLGLQANAQVSYGMIGLTVPQGQELSPALSHQFGILGSYRLKPTVTGMVGYSFRTDQAAYRAPGGASGQNSVSLQGHYLSLFLEWGF